MKKLLIRMSKMCDVSYFIIRSSVILTCIMFACCLLALLMASGFSADTYELHRLAEELFRLPQAILIIAAIASVVIEDFATKE